MRFRSFDLTRFGHFTDQPLSFPTPKSEAPDLHIIVGDNEAGKSTFRVAISDFLFGIRHRSPYDFLHAKPDLQLGAEIEHQGGTEAFKRIKANKATLRRPDDSVLPDQRLADLFGGLDRDGYERLFALDHEMLVSGGRSLVENQSDLSQLLFEAASGISDFHERQASLEARVAELWKRDRRTQTTISRAEKRAKDAEKQLRSKTVTGPTYQKLRRERRVAEKARAEAAHRYAELDAERQHLLRLRAAAPAVKRMAAAEERLAELADDGILPPMLPENARTSLEKVQRTLAGFDSRLKNDREKLALERGQLEDIHPDSAVIEAADEIDALVDTNIAVRDFPDQIAKRNVELEGLTARALETARRLGWSAKDRNDLASLLPAAPARRELRSLKEKFAVLETAQNAAREKAEQTTEDLEQVDGALAALPRQLKPPPGLDDAVEGAERLGDVEERRDALRRTVNEAHRKTAAVAQRLHPWSGRTEELAKLPTIDSNEVAQLIEASEELARKIEDHEHRIVEESTNLKAEEAELERRRAQREIADREALEAARADRDSLWSEIRDGRAVIAAVADKFTSLLEAADTIADRRFEGAQAIAAVEEKEIAAARLRARIDAATQQRDKDREALEEARVTWNTRIEAIGLGDMTPVAYREWLSARDDTLDAWQQEIAAQEEHGAFDKRVSESVAALRAALKDDLAEADENISAELRTLLRQGRKRLEEGRAAAKEHDRLTKEQAEKARLERKATEALECATSQVTAWREAWTSALTACSLPEDTGLEAAGTALEHMEEIERALDEAARIETKNIATMQRDLNAFEAAAKTLAAKVLPEARDWEASQIAKELREILKAARELVAAKQRTESDIEGLEKDIDDLLNAKEQALAELAPVFAAARIKDGRDLDALAAAIEMSDDRRDAETQLETARREADDVSDGVSISKLRAAMDEMPTEQRDIRLAELKSEIEEADGKRISTRDTFKEVSDALAAITGGDLDGSGASHAEEERQRALSDIVDAADEYIDMFIQARLLRWAIERYQAENRSPLLERAAPLFQLLTKGSFTDLQVDVGTTPPTLHARRADRRLVGIEGLSSGTEDQLFLALRIAATKLRLEDDPPMPFVADDLLVNFDDHRAMAGFQVLADLGRQTQVLYLTHHEHLVEIAQEAVGKNINVIML